MVYRHYHWQVTDNCDGIECKALTAYVRIEGKWVRIGYWGSECKKFESLDLQQEEQERITKQRLENIKFEMSKARNRNYSLE